MFIRFFVHFPIALLLTSTAFLLILPALAATLTQGADLGGRMVFSHGTGVGKKSMMQEQAHGHETMGEHEEGHDHGDHPH